MSLPDTMRLITITLAILLVLIQYPLWMGKGGYFRVHELSLQLDAAKEKNEENRLRNARLASEVRDLEIGTEAIEEHARFELGMIKKDEIFIQVIDISKFPGKDKPIEGNLALPVARPETLSANAKPAPQDTEAKTAAGQKPQTEEKPAPTPSGQATPAQKTGTSAKNIPTANKR